MTSAAASDQLTAPFDPVRPARKPRLGMLALTKSTWPGFALLCACSVFASLACFYQFGGYDLSPLVDAFWRTRSGQVPGTDFINTFPLLIYVSAAAIAPLGLGWYELTLVAVVHTALAFAAIMAMTPREERSGRWSLAIASILALPLIYTNHVWHSASSQLVGTAFLYACYRGVRARVMTPGTLGWLATTAAVLVLAKQNVAPPMLLSGIGGMLATAPTGRRMTFAITIALGAFGGLMLALVALGISLKGFAGSYTAVAGRGVPSAEIWREILQSGSSLITLVAVGASLVLMLGAMARHRRSISAGALFLLLMVPAALIPMATDWDAKINDAALPLFLVWCWAWNEDRPTRGNAGLMPFALVVALIFGLALDKGIARERMMTVGPGSFWEPVADQRIDSGYFAGLHTGQRLAHALDEMARFHRAHRQASLFFGPRLEFGYRVNGVPSPRDLPLWWHPGSSYALGDEARIVRDFTEQRIDYLLFLGDDRTRMPASLLAAIDRHYRRIEHPGDLQIYARTLRKSPHR